MQELQMLALNLKKYCQGLNASGVDIKIKKNETRWNYFSVKNLELFKSNT